MAKEKKYRKISDFAANLVFKHDELQLKFDVWIKKIGRKITNAAAAVISFHDFLQMKQDRRILIIKYHIANFIHKNRKKIGVHKKSLMGHFAVAILAAIAIVAMFNHATGFQYSYNGKILGYVDNQEDVVRILGLVSDELTKEYGSRIEIDAENDITFKKVVTLDKEVDNVDDVLRRLTYMSDMEATAYGIYLDGKLFVICESKAAANETLSNVQKEYIDDDKNTEYEEIGFSEDVKVKKLTTKLAYISSVNKATNKILTGGSKEIIYKVKKGDTFSEICADFDISSAALKKINPGIKIDELHIGQKIIINKSSSAMTVLTVEKSTYAEKVEYETVYKKSSSMYKGDSKVTQKGKNGKRVVTAILTRENGEVIDTKVLKSKTITKAVKKIVVKGTKAVPKTAPTGNFIMPVSGYSLTSYFGYRWGRLHEGIDLACSTGTTIRASDGGTVTYAGWYSGYGLFIEISHGNGIRTRYGHCSAINVSVGEKVYQGQKIGEVGNTGNSFGSHCHFEVTVNGSPVDPLGYV